MQFWRREAKNWKAPQVLSNVREQRDGPRILCAVTGAGHWAGRLHDGGHCRKVVPGRPALLIIFKTSQKSECSCEIIQFLNVDSILSSCLVWKIKTYLPVWFSLLTSRFWSLGWEVKKNCGGQPHHTVWPHTCLVFTWLAPMRFPSTWVYVYMQSVGSWCPNTQETYSTQRWS